MTIDHPPRRPRRRVTALAVTTAAIGAGLLPATAAPVAIAAPVAFDTGQTVTWAPCSSTQPAPGTPKLECATVTVPRDWRQPQAGPTLKVAISRVQATDPAHRKGVVFTNPGGPGGPGLALATRLAQAQPRLAARYDIIGMDPRGVGASGELYCDVNTDAVRNFSLYGLRDTSAAAVTSRRQLTSAIAKGCANNPLTPYVNTWQTAHDVDFIRAVLGEEKLNYVGYSYGTWLGAKYAALFPARAGKVVLDSNTAWMDDLSASWVQMPMAFQRRWTQQFLTYAARSPYFAKYVGTTPAQVNATYEQARDALSRYYKQLGAGNQGGDTLDATLRQGLYTDAGIADNAVTLGLLKECLVDNTDWSPEAVLTCANKYVEELTADLPAQPAVSALAQRISTADGDLTALVKAPAGSETDAFQAVAKAATQAAADPETVPLGGAYFAVRCGDGGQWHSPQWWENYQRKIAWKYPLAAYAVTGLEVCSRWTLPAQELPNPDPRKVGPIVTVQAEFDAATAYESTNRNLAQYKAARLVAVQDGGAHGVYGVRGNGCVDAIVNAWLINDITPSARTICDATPLPYESVVYPQVGPVDIIKARPRKTTKITYSPRLRAELEHAIGNID